MQLLYAQCMFTAENEWAVYTAVIPPCTRPSTCGRHTRSCTQAVFMAVYGPCTPLHGPCTRPFTHAVHGPVHTWPSTRPAYTIYMVLDSAVYTGRAYGRVRAIHNRLQATYTVVYGPCTRSLQREHTFTFAICCRPWWKRKNVNRKVKAFYFYSLIKNYGIE